jgi:hypothetical protein
VEIEGWLFESENGWIDYPSTEEVVQGLRIGGEENLATEMEGRKQVSS